MNAYTKRPWVVGTEVFGKFDICVFAGTVRYDSMIARVNGRTSPDDDAPPREQALANAHLIAAAPDLLEYAQLEEAIEDFDCPHDSDGGCDCGQRHDAMYRRARALRRAAIAKAEGLS